MCTGSTISHEASLTATRRPSPGSVADGLVQTLEFQPIPAIRQMLATSGNDHSGNGKRFDRLRHRRLQQRRLPDHEGRRSRSAGCSGSSGATRGSARRSKRVDRSPQVSCTSMQAPASPFVPIRGQSPTYALRCLERTNDDAIGDGVQARSAQAKPSCPSGASCRHLRRRPDLLRRL